MLFFLSHAVCQRHVTLILEHKLNGGFVMNAKNNVCLLLLISCIVLSCGEEEDATLRPVEKTRIVYVSRPVIIREQKQSGFRPDFSIVIGIHRTGADAHKSLEMSKFRISRWSSEALLNLDFPMSGKREVFHAVTISLLEMGFLEDELVSLETVLKKIREIGLLPLTPEQAISLREQFITQPDYSTGKRLGEFFVAMEPMDLFADGAQKIFSIHRDDLFPHPDINVGLWLIANNIENENGPRLFNPLDPEGVDLGGRFVCSVPPELNLDILELEAEAQE